MKTGTIAKRFDLDPKTVTGWTDMFEEVFTAKAKGIGETQRDYQPEDLWVINTIKAERARNTPFEQIRARLMSGDFDKNLPPEFTTIEGDNAITVYAEMREMRVKLDAAEAEIERLRVEVQAERERAERSGQLSQQEIIILNRKIAVLEFQLEQLERKGKADDK